MIMSDTGCGVWKYKYDVFTAKKDWSRHAKACP